MNHPGRPDVLGLPASTALRMVVLTGALVVSALFVGTALHNAVLGEAWQASLQACLGPSGILPDGPSAACQSPAERRRATVALTTAAVTVLLAGVVMVAAPAVLRRRGRLVGADARFERAATALAELATRAGVHPPVLLIGPNSLTTPYCIGRPGRHQIALPRKLALYGNPRLFDALVGHELAHIAHRDVGLSWLARSLTYVLGPLFAVPVVIALVQGEFELAVDIAWRALLLLAVVLLVIRGLMRAREFDADLRAAQRPGVGQVLDTELARVPDLVTGWRAALAWHPPATRRREVIADPVRAATLGILDGVPLGFLSTVAVPLVGNTTAALLLGSPNADQVSWVSALVVGPLVGATLGLGLWRDALAVRTHGRRPATARVALGLLVGGVIGQLTGLALVGVGAEGVPIGLSAALAGAGVLVGGLGELWVSGLGRSVRAIGVWLPAALLGAVTVTAALYAAQQLELASSLGWAVVAVWLTEPGALLVPIGAAGTLAVAAAWAMRPGRDGSTPRWWGGPSPSGPLPGRGSVVIGLGAGLAGGAALAVHRVVAGAALSDVDAVARVEAAILGAGIVGAVVVVVLALLRQTAGAGAGLLAGPVASTTTALVFLAIVAVVGGNPLPFALTVVGGALGAGWVTAVGAALTSLLPLAGARSTALAALLAATMAATSAGGVMVGRSVAVPGLADPEVCCAVDSPGPIEQEDPVLPPSDIPRDLYADVVGPPLLDGRRATADWFRRLQTEKPPAPESARRIRAEQVPALRALLAEAQSVAPTDPVVKIVHGHAVAGARMHLAGFETLASALEDQDQGQLDAADVLLRQGNAEWQQWASGVLTLSG